MNVVILIGNLTRDAKIFNSSSSDTKVAKLSLAVPKDPFNGKPGIPNYISVTCFGRLADFCERFAKKGLKLVVMGQLDRNEFTGRDGNKVTDYTVTAHKLEFAESRVASALMVAAANKQELPTLEEAQQYGSRVLVDRPAQEQTQPTEQAVATQPEPTPIPVAQPQMDTSSFMTIPDGVDSELPFV